MIYYIDTEIELDQEGDYKDVNVTVEFDYEPAEKEVWSYSNGDPGHPGVGELINIISVRDAEGYCYLHKLSSFQIDKLVTLISNTKSDIYNGY